MEIGEDVLEEGGGEGEADTADLGDEDLDEM
jgi:hypothetical protein